WLGGPRADPTQAQRGRGGTGNPLHRAGQAFNARRAGAPQARALRRAARRDARAFRQDWRLGAAACAFCAFGERNGDMTNGGSIKLFQFPRMFGIPNLSPFCCKLETWLRITRIPYEVVDSDPRKAPKGKLPFIEDGGVRIGDTSLIIDHLKRTRGVDPDSRL